MWLSLAWPLQRGLSVTPRKASLPLSLPLPPSSGYDQVAPVWSYGASGHSPLKPVSCLTASPLTRLV